MRPVSTISRLGVCVVVASLGVAPSWAGAASKLPAWPVCQQVAGSVLQPLPPGQPVAQSVAKQVFGALAAKGWKVAEQKAILQRVPSDNEFLIQQLATPRGRAFARTMASRPDDYSRLDRMGRLPDGQKMIRDLMAGPDGYHDMLTYMISKQGGATLWGIVPNSADARDFNVPTGRIYTREQLLAVLKEAHGRERTTASRTVR